MAWEHWASILGVAFLGMAFLAGTAQPAEEDNDNDARAGRFIANYEATIRPLEIDCARQWWAASTTGRDEDFRKKRETETKLDLELANPAVFAELKAIHDQPIRDPLLARQIEVLYRSYLSRQVEPDLLKAMIAKSNGLEQAFNVYRAKVDGKELTENQVREVLRHSKDSAERRAVWEASKGVGPAIVDDLKELVRLRNQAAGKLGFKNYHAMVLYLGEQNQDELLKLFDELDALTREPFLAAKAELDAALAQQYGIPVDQLRPWHYHDPFFQQAPAVSGEKLDAVYAPIDIVRVVREFYAGIGLPVDAILQRSDLYEKPGKSPHAFCTDIDRQGDVRVLANVVPGREWLSVMLHELGHAVYSENIPQSVPYVLRTSSHALTTEGIAMMFQRFEGNAEWLTAMGVSVPEPEQFNRTTAALRRNSLLIFSRWCQVMFRFEMALYDNPDQDLNRLWWDLVEKYQGLHRPEGRDLPDYASKIHLVSAPVYYHNYLLGELFATQLHRTIVRQLLPGQDPVRAIYVGNPAVGKFLRERVFAPGDTMSWNDLTRYATGEELNARAFAAEFQGK
jgi:peptidyl-dipeptidase A